MNCTSSTGTDGVAGGCPDSSAATSGRSRSSCTSRAVAWSKTPPTASRRARSSSAGHHGVPVAHRTAHRAGLDHHPQHVRRLGQRLGRVEAAEEPRRAAVGPQHRPAAVHHHRRERLVLGEHRGQRDVHAVQLVAAQRCHRVRRREARGEQHPVALPQRYVEGQGQPQHHLPAGPGAAGLDEADVARRRLGRGREVELADPAHRAPVPEQVTELGLLDDGTTGTTALMAATLGGRALGIPSLPGNRGAAPRHRRWCLPSLQPERTTMDLTIHTADTAPAELDRPAGGHRRRPRLRAQPGRRRRRVAGAVGRLRRPPAGGRLGRARPGAPRDGRRRRRRGRRQPVRRRVPLDRAQRPRRRRGRDRADAPGSRARRPADLGRLRAGPRGRAEPGQGRHEHRRPRARGRARRSPTCSTSSPSAPSPAWSAPSTTWPGGSTWTSSCSRGPGRRARPSAPRALARGWPGPPAPTSPARTSCGRGGAWRPAP